MIVLLDNSFLDTWLKAGLGDLLLSFGHDFVTSTTVEAEILNPNTPKDVNQDGITQPGELTTIAYEGVISINLGAAKAGRHDQLSHNSILYWGSFNMAAAGQRQIAMAANDDWPLVQAVA